MQHGDKFYVVRYSTKIYKKCIEAHESVINKYGYCWFAKCGKKVAENTLKKVLEDKSKILLYSRDASYIADFVDYSYTIQDEAMPEYYAKHLYTEPEKIAVFLKLSNIRKLEQDITNRLRVITTGRMVDSIFKHSSCSNLYAIYESDEERKKRKLCALNHEGFCENIKSDDYMYKCKNAGECAYFE